MTALLWTILGVLWHAALYVFFALLCALNLIMFALVAVVVWGSACEWWAKFKKDMQELYTDLRKHWKGEEDG